MCGGQGSEHQTFPCVFSLTAALRFQLQRFAVHGGQAFLLRPLSLQALSCLLLLFNSYFLSISSRNASFIKMLSNEPR